MTWQESSDYGYGCRLGVEWNESNTNGGTYTLAPTVWRLDQYSTSNSGSTFSETLKTEPSGSNGYWSGIGWGSGSGWRKVDTFGSRAYSKAHSSKTIQLVISTDSEFGTWSSSFHYLGSKTFTASITIPARTSYTVSFNANSGSGAPSSQTKWYGESLTLSSTKPTRSGYSFRRWNTNTSDSGTAYSAGGTYTGNAALSLYAIWNPIIYYKPNGASGSDTSQTKTYGTTATLKAASTYSRSGFTFKRWNTNTTDTGTGYSAGASYTSNATVTLYAIWNRTVTYNKNCSDTVGSLPSAQTAIATSAITLSSNTPTRTGYAFKQWNTKTDNSGTTYAKGATYAKNAASVTLYAIWNRTVTYNANGGSNAPSAQTEIATKNITITSSQPTRSGHTFLGWNTSADGTGTNYSAGSTYSGANVTLYAKWRVDIQLTGVTCELTDSNGTADALGQYVKVAADYDSTLSGADVESITATMTHAGGSPAPSQTVTEDLGQSGSVEFLFGPYSYTLFDPHGNYSAGTLVATNSLGSMSANLNIATTEYTNPSIGSVTAFRTHTSEEGGVLVHDAADDGTDLGIDVSWTAYSSGSQSRSMSVTVERSDGVLIATRTFSNIATSPTRLDVWADAELFPDDVLVNGVLLPTDKQFNVTVTLSDAYSGSVPSAKSSRSDVITVGYFTLDFLGDAFLYNKTADSAVDQSKVYYTRSGSGTEESPYVYAEVASPVAADLGTYYEANGPKPGHGIGIGKPATREALDVGMDSHFDGIVTIGDLADKYTEINGPTTDNLPNGSIKHIGATVDTYEADNGVTENHHRSYSSYDSNNNPFGYMQQSAYTNGRTACIIGARNFGTGSAISNQLRLEVLNDGTRNVEVSEAAPWLTAFHVGDYVSKDQTSNVSMATGGYTNVCSISVPAGTWVMQGNLTWASNSTGRRHAYISVSSAASNAIRTESCNAVSGGGTSQNLCGISVVASTSTYYLVGWQNSGAALNATGYLRAVRIK